MGPYGPLEAAIAADPLCAKRASLWDARSAMYACILAACLSSRHTLSILPLRGRSYTICINSDLQAQVPTRKMRFCAVPQRSGAHGAPFFVGVNNAGAAASNSALNDDWQAWFACPP